MRARARRRVRRRSRGWTRRTRRTGSTSRSWTPPLGRTRTTTASSAFAASDSPPPKTRSEPPVSSFPLLLPFLGPALADGSGCVETGRKWCTTTRTSGSSGASRWRTRTTTTSPASPAPTRPSPICTPPIRPVPHIPTPPHPPSQAQASGLRQRRPPLQGLHAQPRGGQEAAEQLLPPLPTRLREQCQVIRARPSPALPPSFGSLTTKDCSGGPQCSRCRVSGIRRALTTM